MKVCRVGVLFGPQLTLYSFGPNHPMNSYRIMKFYELLPRDFVLLDPVMAGEEEIALFHRKDYIEFVKRMSERGSGYLDYRDTPAFKGVYEASAYVVGSTLRALDSVLRGRSITLSTPWEDSIMRGEDQPRASASSTI